MLQKQNINLMKLEEKEKLLLDMMLELYIILKNKAILQKLDLLFLNL